MATVGTPARDFEHPSAGARLVLLLRAARNSFENGVLARWQAVAIPALAVLLYAAAVIFSGARPFWHDELYTFYIAQAPTLGQMFHQIRLDLNPPLEYLVVRGSISVFGTSEYAARLPSILAFFVASGCLYWFMKRRFSSSYGVLAVAVLWTTPFFYYATEARPYALVLALFGIALLAWTYRAEGRRPKTALAILALAVCGMMLTHFFAMFYLLPFGLAELVRDYRRRKIDFPVWASLILPIAIPFVYLSLMARYEASAFPHAFLARPGVIYYFFFNTLSPEGWVLLPVICFAIFVAFRRELKLDRSLVPNRFEAALIVGMIAIPFVILAVMIVTHGSFNKRYAIPVGFAYGILVAFFTAIYTGASRLAAAVASCALFAYIALVGLLPDLHRYRAGEHLRPDTLAGIAPELPLVDASGLTFLEMDKYSSPATVKRLYYLTDPQFALHYAHASIFEGLSKVKHVFPIRASVTPYPQFVAEHRRFLVLGTPGYPEDWLIKRLMDVHASLRYLGDFNIGDFAGPFTGYQLYEVTMPESGASPK